MITCGLAAVISILFLVEAFQSGFHLYGWLIILGNLIYIPGILIFKKKIFVPWSIGYCIILMFAAAQSTARLYNNFTPLFCILIVYMIKPNFKWSLILFYSIALSACMLFQNESIIHYLQHMARAAWIFYVSDYVISQKFTRKKLQLTDDEIMILEELNEKQLLKAVTCFSKNTLTQKLKEARERNGIPSNAELLAEYNLTKK